MIKRKIQNRIVLTGFAVMLLFLVIFYLPSGKGKDDRNSVAVIDTWTINRPQAGMYVMETILPEDSAGLQTMAFWSGFSETEVSLNGVVLYSSRDQERFGKSPIPKWNYVVLPKNTGGAKLSMSLRPIYKFSETLPKDVLYGDREHIMNWIHKKYAFCMLLDNILLVTGMMFMLLCVFEKTDVRYRICHFSFGMTAVLFNVWFSMGKSYAHHRVPLYFNSLFGYLAFFLIPFSLLIYLRMRVLRKPKFVWVCDLLIGINMLLVMAVFIMQGLGIRDVRENMVMGYLFMAATGGLAVISAIYYFMKERERTSVLTVTNGFLYIGAVISIYIKEISGGTGGLAEELFARLFVTVIIIFETVLFFSRLQEKERIHESVEQQNQNLRLHIMTSQIKPHFILNTLGAIRSMIRVNPDYASDLLYDFSQYIRKNMDQKDYTKQIPFLEEMEYIDTYLRLEKLRFGDRLKIEKDLQMVEFWILPLTIQPFVENAVKHGLMEKKKGGTLWIRTSRQEQNIMIEIEDDGIGFDVSHFEDDFIKGNSIGMKSAITRLKYEMHGVCTVESSMKEGESGTRIRILVPAERRR